MFQGVGDVSGQYDHLRIKLAFPFFPAVLASTVAPALAAMGDSTVVSDQQPPGPGQTTPSRGPYIAVITNRNTNLVIRGFMLFSIGVFLALVLNLLQVDHVCFCPLMIHLLSKKTLKEKVTVFSLTAGTEERHSVPP